MKTARGIDIFISVMLILLIVSGLNATQLLSFQKNDSLQLKNAHRDSAMFYKDRLPVKENQRTSFFGYFVRVIVVTGIIIVFMLLGFQWYKKNVLNKSGLSQNTIKILGRKAVGPKQFIVLVSMEGKKYALGVTDHSVNLLTDLGELGEFEDVPQEAEHGGSFSALLKKLSRGQNAS